jgi:hypothetical protein
MTRDQWRSVKTRSVVPVKSKSRTSIGRAFQPSTSTSTSSTSASVRPAGTNFSRMLAGRSVLSSRRKRPAPPNPNSAVTSDPAGLSARALGNVPRRPRSRSVISYSPPPMSLTVMAPTISKSVPFCTRNQL